MGPKVTYFISLFISQNYFFSFKNILFLFLLLLFSSVAVLFFLSEDISWLLVRTGGAPVVVTVLMCSMTTLSRTLYLMCSMTTSSSTSSFPSLMSSMSCKSKKPRKVRQKKRKKLGVAVVLLANVFFLGVLNVRIWGW